MKVLVPSMFLSLMMLGQMVVAEESATEVGDLSCKETKSVQVDYSDARELDTLTVKVEGNPCSDAAVTIQVVRPDNKVVYEYQGFFVEHIPWLIHEPNLRPLVAFFVEKVLGVAMAQSTADLQPYTGVETFYENTNNFVIIPLDEYESLRTHADPLPLLWHATGDSSWLHAIYDPEQQGSRIIMRGGVFE